MRANVSDFFFPALASMLRQLDAPVELEPWHEKFEPFVRRDRYGPMGLRLTRLEVVRMTLFWLTGIPVLRTVICLYALVSFCLVCTLAQYLPPKTRNRILPSLAYLHVRTVLFCCGFYWIKRRTVGDGTRNPPRQAAALVSNHVSWLDILVHMSIFFPSFVAKVSTRRAPIVGIISQLMDCIYVDREPTAGTSGAAAKVQLRQTKAAAAQAGLGDPGGFHERPVLLFPEGTTTNGRYLLPFRTGAFIAGVPVQPVLLLYKWKGFSPAWECITAGRHIFFLLSQFKQSLEVVFLPVYVPSEEERKDPALYASNVRTIMAQAGGFKMTHHTLQHKRVYQSRLVSSEPSDGGGSGSADQQDLSAGPVDTNRASENRVGGLSNGGGTHVGDEARGVSQGPAGTSAGGVAGGAADGLTAGGVASSESAPTGPAVAIQERDAATAAR